MARIAGTQNAENITAGHDSSKYAFKSGNYFRTFPEIIDLHSDTQRLLLYLDTHGNRPTTLWGPITHCAAAANSQDRKIVHIFFLARRRPKEGANGHVEAFTMTTGGGGFVRVRSDRIKVTEAKQFHARREDSFMSVTCYFRREKN